MNALLHFIRDESGSVSVEACIWFAGLVGLGSMVGNRIVVPLIERGREQAALNQETIDLIQQAAVVCTGGV